MAQQQKEVDGHLPGKPWTGIEIKEVAEVPAEKTDPKSLTRQRIMVAVGILFLGYVVFGMLTSNEEMIADTFRLVQYAAIAVLSWAFGRIDADHVTKDLHEEETPSG